MSRLRAGRLRVRVGAARHDLAADNLAGVDEPGRAAGGGDGGASAASDGPGSHAQAADPPPFPAAGTQPAAPPPQVGRAHVRTPVT